MSSLKAGVVGAGRWGKNLIRACAKAGVLAAVTDSDRAQLALLEAEYGSVRTTCDLHEFLHGDLDCVLIAAPAKLHAELAMAALRCGKHVFVEKPFAMSVAEGQAIADLADRAGLQAFAGHLLLYHPAMVRLQELIADGSIGAVHHVRSRRLSLGRVRDHENVWWSFAPHDVALMLSIFGEEPLDARGALHASLGRDIADFAYVDYRFSDGRSAHIEVSWMDPARSQRLDVFGSQGVLSVDDSREGASLRSIACGVRRDSHGALETWSDPAVEVAVARDEPLLLEVKAFLHSVRTGVPAKTDAAHAVQVLRALELAQSKILETEARRGVCA